MIKNYILLFIRNLKRHRLFSFINILGLTISIASTLLIYLYVNHELSYDRFHAHAERIYRVNQTFIWGENNNAQFASTGPGVAYAIRQELEDVELITSIHTPGEITIQYTNQQGKVISHEEDKVLAADTNFFEMFNFPLMYGDETALGKKNSMILTASIAKKYFNSEAEAVGKFLTIKNHQGETAYEVTGIVKNTPANSYINFDILLSMRNFPVDELYWSWIWTQLETYVRLEKSADVERVRENVAKLPPIYAEETLKRLGTTYEEYTASGKKWELFLQPLTSIHLPDELVLNRLNDSGNKKAVLSFIGAGIFIIILACFNFMNLSTAQFTRRVKEASIRKILGLGKSQLSLGYFLEALCFCFVAMVVALGLVQLILPSFNLLTGNQFTLQLMDNPQILLGLIVLTIIMAIVSSSYPALFLSSFHPVEAVKGKIRSGKKGKAFRNGLVTFQFSLSIILILCTAIVFQQLTFISDKDPGFNRDNLLVIENVEKLDNSESLLQELKSISSVEKATWNTAVPPNVWQGDNFFAEGHRDVSLMLNYSQGDEEYLPALDLQLLAGRNFNKNNPYDIYKVIINESTVKKIGFSSAEDAIGKKLYANADSDRGHEIIGVVSDFNYNSLLMPIEPFALFHVGFPYFNREREQYIVLKIPPQNREAWDHMISSINKSWSSHAGSLPFEYSFVDQSFNAAFQSQQRLGSVLLVMSGLAILIAGLGLLGMVIYALEQRKKEIGIRKVSGASVGHIFILVSREYTKLIIISFAIGAPISYWLMQQWLMDFPYKITPSILLFILSGLTVMVITILITAYHSLQAARLNPAATLKDE